MLAVCFVQSVTIRLCIVLSSFAGWFYQVMTLSEMRLSPGWSLSKSMHIDTMSLVAVTCDITANCWINAQNLLVSKTKPIFQEKLQERWSLQTSCLPSKCLTPTNSTSLVFFNQGFGWHHSFSLCYNFSFHIGLSCSCEMRLIQSQDCRSVSCSISEIMGGNPTGTWKFFQDSYLAVAQHVTLKIIT